MSRSKRYLKALETIDQSKVYTTSEAVDIIKSFPAAKFDETVDLSFKLGVDTKKSDSMVRGSVVLPNGLGRKVKVLVFCEPEKEEEAKEAGADYMGGQDIIDKIIKEGWLDFDYCISSPGMMKLVSRLGKVLGPRGLMPSPKTGTVTDKIGYAVKEAKRGKVDFRADKTGCVKTGVGKVSFPKESLEENINSFIAALTAAKPSVIKGDYIRSAYMSTSMGPSLSIKV